MRPNISVTAVVTGQVEFATVHGSIVRAAAQGMPVESFIVVADRPASIIQKTGINPYARRPAAGVGIGFARRLGSPYDQEICGAE